MLGQLKKLYASSYNGSFKRCKLNKTNSIQEVVLHEELVPIININHNYNFNDMEYKLNKRKFDSRKYSGKMRSYN